MATKPQTTPAKARATRVPGEDKPKEEVVVAAPEPVVAAAAPAPEEAKPEAKTAKAKPEAKAPGELPDQSEIDPTKIDRAVMSKQGWVVPNKPAHPAQLR